MGMDAWLKWGHTDPSSDDDCSNDESCPGHLYRVLVVSRR